MSGCNLTPTVDPSWPLPPLETVNYRYAYDSDMSYAVVRGQFTSTGSVEPDMIVWVPSTERTGRVRSSAFWNITIHDIHIRSLDVGMEFPNFAELPREEYKYRLTVGSSFNLYLPGTTGSWEWVGSLPVRGVRLVVDSSVRSENLVLRKPSVNQDLMHSFSHWSEDKTEGWLHQWREVSPDTFWCVDGDVDLNAIPQLVEVRLDVGQNNQFAGYSMDMISRLGPVDRLLIRLPSIRLELSPPPE